MKILPLLLTTLSLASATAFGNNYSFNGDTTGASPFNRPTEPGDALSDIGTAVPYYALNFSVNLSGSYNFSALPGDSSSFDSFIHVYSGSFNPSAPLNNFLAANDDAPGGSAFGSALNGLSLIAGNNYTFVIDGFGNSDFGPFSANISGPGSVSPVPEPSALALIGIGSALAGLARRRLTGN
jgi:hypothetical protein